MKLKYTLHLFALFMLSANAGAAIGVAQAPLFATSPVEPRVMLLMSRDHELSKKAYNDYSDLDNDGALDTTYKDSIAYYGYFDSDKCYSYTSSRFEPAAAVTSGTHQCDGTTWSGNFLNWATMTRLDVVRKVLYGGFRSTDSTGTTLGTTVLERAFMPPDVHAFAKVFEPAGGATDVAKYTPYAQAAITLCNVTDMGAGVQAGNINTVNNSATTQAPLIKVSSGAWPQWAMTEILQCQWKEDFAAETSPRPTKATQRLTGTSDLIARVAVCVPGMLESNCKTYSTRTSTPVDTVKPTGLLQQYGDIDAERIVRFGLMTGSYKKNTSGGVLRKNIKLLANNSGTPRYSPSICGDNHADDEVDVCTGQFINQGASDRGIIDTLNRIHIAGYKTPASGAITTTNVCGGGYGNSAPFACSASDLLSGTNGTCVDWGNPLSEMYHEALRYFAGKTSATAAYAVDDSAATAVISGLGQATWNASSDPLPSTAWCALSSIIVLSTGLTSLDNATITTDITGLAPATLTDEVGTAEGISGSYLIGSNGVTSNNLCSAKTLSSLSSASGICPELPHMKGGYLIAGLAKANRSLDLRSTSVGPGGLTYPQLRSTRWTGINADWVARQPLATYTVGLAENLPNFEIDVGAGKVSLVPACRSNGSTVCSMTDLRVESQTGTAGSFLVAWEDNSAGGDYDMDTVARIQYCVGPSAAGCNDGAVASNQIRVTVAAMQSATGSGMELGYTVSGTTSDGTVFPIKIPGTATCNPTECGSATNNNDNPNDRFFSLLTSPPSARCNTINATNWPACPNGGPQLPIGVGTGNDGIGCPSGSNCGCPKTTTYTQSATPAGLLKNPLWYAAKYGSPENAWDLKNNITDADGADGEPDNYFDVRDPAQLFNKLSVVLDRASIPESSASSIATNSTRLDTQTVVYQAKFSSLDWSGQLLAFQLGTNGEVITPAAWDTNTTLTTSSTRNIKTYNGSAGANFATWATLTAAQQACLNKASTCPGGAFSGAGDGLGASRLSWLNGQPVTGMRARTKVLGDIVNSDPIFVYRQNYGHHLVSHNLDSLADGNAMKQAYANYLDSSTDTLSKTRAAHIPLVFVGANDGMMHAFRADTGNANSGKEVFAYVPNSVFPNLAELTDPAYTHRYYVDATAGVGDAYIDTGDGLGLRWRTILVSGIGAGGKAVFALDITDSTDIKVLWEKNNTSTGWSELGTLVNTPSITRIISTGNERKWAAVLGNGYNSASGKAMLMIVDLATGAMLQTVDTAVGGDNGLGAPAIYNANFNAYVGDYSGDAIYAGDLKGNIWKFTSTGGTWGVAYSGLPHFTATDGTNPQPITSALEIGSAPLNQTGVMIQFGTGRYFATGDTATTSQQSLYGILDDGTTTDRITTTDRSELQAQTLTEVTVSGVNYRVASANSVSYPSKRGWYIDLPTSKERVVSAPLLRHGRVIFTSMIPSADACLFGGSSWLIEVDATTGANLGYSVFDLNDDNLFNTADYITSGGTQVPVSGVQYTTGIVKTPAVVSAGEIEYKITSSTSSEINVKSEKGMLGHPRSSWREIR